MQEEVQKIVVKDIRQGRKQSLVINNFYSLITIAIMSIVMIWYVNYVLPEQNKQEENEMKAFIKNKRIENIRIKRDSQIELSRKLNNKVSNDQ